MAEHAATVARLEEPTFLVLAYDGDGDGDGGEASAGLRDRELEGHLAYVEKHCMRYLACGPMHSPDRSRLIGSFFLLAAADGDDARRFSTAIPILPADSTPRSTCRRSRPRPGAGSAGSSGNRPPRSATVRPEGVGPGT